MVTIGVLALQGDVAEHVRALENSGARALLVRRVCELELFDTLYERIASGMPVYGTCAGMIMLASSMLDGRADQRSFGALDMVVRRNAFGRQVDSYEEDLDVVGLEGGPFHAVFIRAPWVESVGEGVEVIARAGNSAEGPIVAVRRGNVMATSFHPEVGGDDRIHAMFVDMVKRA